MNAKNRNSKFWRGLGLGVVGGYLGVQQTWALREVVRKNVERTLRDHSNKALGGLTFSAVRETETYLRNHTIEDGIERIVYA